MGIIAWIVLGLGAGLLAQGEAVGWVAISAAAIRIFERLGWATKVRWPTPASGDQIR